MFVRIAVLADFASIAEGNKLNILGIFTNIQAYQVPVTHAQMKLVAQLEFDALEAGNRNLSVILVNDDGKELVSINGTIIIEPGQNGSSSSINTIFDFNNLIFREFGRYEFRILLDSEELCAIPLNVIELPQPGQ